MTIIIKCQQILTMICSRQATMIIWFCFGILYFVCFVFYFGLVLFICYVSLRSQPIVQRRHGGRVLTISCFSAFLHRLAVFQFSALCSSVTQTKEKWWRNKPRVDYCTFLAFRGMFSNISQSQYRLRQQKVNENKITV